MSSDTLGDAYVGQALVTYVTSNPFLYYGAATAPVMLAGLAAIRRHRDRRVRLLWLIAVTDIVVVGLTPVAQSRYIFLGIVLLVMLGADELHRLVRAREPAARRALGWIAAAAVAASWISVVITLQRLEDSRARRSAGTSAAIAAIRADARGAPCEVMARRSTQLQWYTGCTAVYYPTAETLAKKRVYLVHEPGSPHQPEREGRPGVPRVILEHPKAIVTRYDPA
jgi:hypothetical protein